MKALFNEEFYEKSDDQESQIQGKVFIRLFGEFGRVCIARRGASQPSDQRN